MADDSSEDPACATTADTRESEHRRRNQLQAELLRKAYDRSRHATFIEALLRRETDEEGEKEEAKQPGERRPR